MKQYQKQETSKVREDAYQSIVSALKRHCYWHPELTRSDVLAILGKAAGYYVGQHVVQGREAARGVVTTNMDVATREVAGEQA